VIAVEYVSNADLVLAFARSCVKSIRGSNHHRLVIEVELFQHERREFLAIANWPLRDNIERGAGLAANRARNLLDRIAHQTSTPLVFAPHFREVAIWSIHRGHRGQLIHRRRTETRLTELQ